MPKPNNRDAFFHEKISADLKYLRLPKFLEIYRETVDFAADKNLSYLEFLCTLLGEEASAREQKAIQAKLKRAKLPNTKTIDDYDFSFPTRIAKQKILRIFDCDFIAEGKNVVFVGPIGVGKTHLMTALGYAAVQKGINIRFVRIVDMLNDLSTAQNNGTLGRAIRAYVKPQALLCDELGYLPVDKTGADLLFQVVSARYEQGSIVITTNRPFKEWGKVFNADNTMATAMIDRLMHHGDVIVINGKSYRMRGKNPDGNSDKDE